MQKKLIFACYGGGHLESLLPVWYALKKSGYFSLEFIGFTLAKFELETQGETCAGYHEAFGELVMSQGWEVELDSLIPELENEKIALADHNAYYRAGIQSLVQLYGREEAVRIFLSEGRKSFLPSQLMKMYLQKVQPNLVVTTASPRSEALVQAACELKIPCLVISDLFLVREADYMCSDSYCADVTVLNEKVALFLDSKGYRGNIHVTGNPAFDDFVNKPHNFSTKKEDAASRDDYFLGENINLTWIGSGSGSAGGGKYIESQKAIDYLERFAAGKNVTVGFRPHPNDRSEVRLPATFRMLKGYSLHDVLSSSDIVLVEGSTVAIKAALMGAEVWALGQTPYPKMFEAYGIAKNIRSLDGIEMAFENFNKGVRFKTENHEIVAATNKISNIIFRILKGV